MRDLIDRYLDAYNRMDVPAMLNTMHAGVVFENYTKGILSVRTQGVAELRHLAESSLHLFSARRLRLLQPHSLLINTARGEIIDESALATLLAEGGIAGAGLDVFADEPNVPERLLGLANVVLTPHVASATVETRAAMTRVLVENVLAFIRGEPLPNPIDR